MYIDAPTDIRFYVKAPFSKYGAAANYYISPSYVGDTPTVGYSMTVTAAGLIQITLPSIASFTSAVINFALNAPAVGTNFPLNLDSANLTNNGITGLTGTAATTAVTSGSGKVGETISSTISTTTATTSEADVTGASITLGIGVWEIKYSLTTNYSTGASLNNAGYTIVTITDSANTHIGKTERMIYCKTVAAVTNINYSSLCASAVVNISSSTTYKVRLKRVDSSGTGTGAVEVTAGVLDCTFYATRIA